MKKTALFLLSLLLFSSTLVAQVNITVGKPYPVIDASSKHYFYQDQEMLTVKVIKKGIVIQKMDVGALNIISSKTSIDFPKEYTVENILACNDHYYVLYSTWDKKNKTTQLFQREIDFKQGDFKGAGIPLITINQKIANFYYSYSFEKNRVLIGYRVAPEIRNDAKSYDVIGLHVFDENMQSVWNTKLTMPYTEKKMNILDYAIDEDGNGYILSMVYNDNTTDEKKGKYSDANYHIELFKITAHSAELKISQVSVGNKFINNIAIFDTPHKYMVCAGYYHNGINTDATDGIFLFKVGKDADIYDMSNHEIPLEIINQYISEKAQRKNARREEKGDDTELNHLDLRQISVEADGSIVLVGERYHIETRTYYNSKGGAYYRTFYHYDDMLLSKIDKDGNLAWMKKLPKRQVGESGKGGMSYKLMNMASSNNYYLFFLDHEKNMKLSTDDYPSTHSDGQGGFLTAYQIEKEKGTVNKISILNTRNVNNIEVYQFAPSRILPISSDAFVLEFYKKGKEDLLLKATLKD